LTPNCVTWVSPSRETRKTGLTPRTPQRRFVDCVKGDAKPPVTLEASHRATVCCHLANIAYLVGRAVPWDPATESIPDDPEAAALLSRARRKGYELPGA